MEIDTKELNKRIDIMHIEKAKMDYFKYVFEKDDNGAFVRLIIPLNFVKSIIPSKNEPMNYIGKKEIDLNSEEVPLLKLYARALKDDTVD